jgi:predicted nucleic acid-binding protein
LTVIADATVLIGLHQIDHLFLLPALFEHIVIPPAVAEETKRSVPRPDWLAIRAPRQIPPSFSKHIGWGEGEAIALALEIHPDAFIVDDYAARVLAERLGIAIIGTAGILRLAKKATLIPNVREPLDSLRACGFHLSDVVYEAVLHASGEL